MATVDDVVKESGVSRSTVFRFLNGQNVREDSKNKIIESMKKLNYKTEEIKKLDNLNIEISICHDHYDFQGFSDVVSGITEYAQENGIRIYLSSRTGEQIDKDYTDINEENKVHGVLVVGKNKVDELKEASYLSKNNIPFILVNRKINDENISYVTTDVEKGAYEITNYLISLGHKDILVAGNPDELLIDEHKMRGYKKALEDNGVEFNEKLYIKTNKINLENDLRKALEAGNTPTAFFGICDSDAIKFMNVATSMGMKIPKDISIVGMDNISMAQYINPPLTTIDMFFKKMGSVAMEQLMQLIDKKIKSIKTIIDHELIVRESCKKLK
ncbi:LacI family DNA-binding transcriptional regulator [Clostridium grantii]|uniref:Regulatory protein, lacI family n=1 Tax=Clostridium grantii DSM 8605 TaxID=1121316 RepID=A0A1M5T3B1_9CLOT|nr:LacI family DNA-binding transcriptional regulator [Clostridium grantii]SHH45231.1 regulatory protein, lacI family [Clostridium grantii DSM 8605]